MRNKIPNIYKIYIHVSLDTLAHWLTDWKELSVICNVMESCVPILSPFTKEDSSIYNNNSIMRHVSFALLAYEVFWYYIIIRMPNFDPYRVAIWVYSVHQWIQMRIISFYYIIIFIGSQQPAFYTSV